MNQCPNCKMIYPKRKYFREPDIMDVLGHQERAHKKLYDEYFKQYHIVSTEMKIIREKENKLREWYKVNFGVSRGF